VLRLSYLALSSVFTVIRLLPMSDTDKDIEILTLRHQLAILQRQIDTPRLTGTGAFLAALLHRLPKVRLRQLQLIVSPDTIMRWHRDLIRRRHAKISRHQRPGRPPTRRSVQALVLRLARENKSWGYRRIHGELAGLGITVAPSTVWEILKRHGIEPTPDRDHTTWPAFLRSPAQAIVACDFFTATTLTGVTYYVVAVIEHATRRVRILGVTVHPWVIHDPPAYVQVSPYATCCRRARVRRAFRRPAPVRHGRTASRKAVPGKEGGWLAARVEAGTLGHAEVHVPRLRLSVR